MASKAELALILSLVDDVSKTAKSVRGELKGIGADAGGVQGALLNIGKVGLTAVVAGAAAATAAVGAIGAAAFKAAMDIDEAMDTIAIGTGATGEELDGLKTVFTDVFANTSADAATVSGVLAELNSRLGVTGEEAYSLTLKTTEMARMMGTDATQAASTFARTLGDWGVSAEEGSGLMDRMFVATQQSGIGFERLNELVVQFGAPMRNFGFTLDDSIALLSKWEKEGVNTETVMSSLRIAAGKFAKAGKPLRESLLASFDSIQNNTDATAALAEGMEVFGARAGPDMVAAIREGRFAIDDMVAMMGDADDAILKTARSTEDWPEKLARAKNRLMVLIAPIGDALMSLAGKGLDYVMPMLDDLGAAIEAHVLPAIEKIGPAVDIFFQGLENGKGPIESFKDVLWKLLPPGMAADLTGVITKIQELVANVKEGDWDTIGGDLWGMIQKGFEGAITLGGNIAETLRGKISMALGLSGSDDSGARGDDSWGAIGAEIRERIVQGIVNLSGVLADFTGRLKAKADSEEGMTDAQATGTAIARWILNAIKGLFSTDAEGQTLIGELVANMRRAALNLHDTSAAVGASIGTGMITEMTTKIESEEEVAKIREAMRRAIKRSNPVDMAIEGVRELTGAIGQLQGQGWWDWLDKRLPWSGTPQGNANGTDWWQGGPTLVGERGPEIVNVPRGSQILNNRESQGMGGNTTYITIAAGAIVVNGAGSPRETGIGVLTELRGLGVSLP